MNDSDQFAPASDRSDPRLYRLDGVPWCHFEAGSLYCVNDPCQNPNHRTPPRQESR